MFIQKECAQFFIGISVLGSHAKCIHLKCLTISETVSGKNERINWTDHLLHDHKVFHLLFPFVEINVTSFNVGGSHDHMVSTCRTRNSAQLIIFQKRLKEKRVIAKFPLACYTSIERKLYAEDGYVDENSQIMCTRHINPIKR